MEERYETLKLIKWIKATVHLPFLTCEARLAIQETAFDAMDVPEDAKMSKMVIKMALESGEKFIKSKKERENKG